MTLATALRLGRVSNLPTVWTNTLAGIVLAGGAVAPARTALLLAGLSLFYVGGMYLNDAFDAEVDARERPERPIPSGAARAGTVLVAGFGLLALGEAVVAVVAWALPGGAGLPPVLAGLALGATIVWYDARHKQQPLAPVVMGLCRVLVYLTAGLAAAPGLPSALLAGAAVLLLYLIGLTYAARHETLAELGSLWPLACLAAPFVWGAAHLGAGPVLVAVWVAFLAWVGLALARLLGRPRDVPDAVGRLIAGISLLDALLLAGHGRPALAVVAALAVPLTRALQRHVPGT
jgi:UbiA prenyltransferase family